MEKVIETPVLMKAFLSESHWMILTLTNTLSFLSMEMKISWQKLSQKHAVGDRNDNHYLGKLLQLNFCMYVYMKYGLC